MSQIHLRVYRSHAVYCIERAISFLKYVFLKRTGADEKMRTAFDFK